MFGFESIKRGFVPVFLEDSRAGDVSTLMGRLQDELAYKGKRLLSLLLVAEDIRQLDIDIQDGDIDIVDINRACDYLLSSSTAYSAFNIPRMIDLDARGIEMFFLKLAERAATRDDEEHLVSALVSSMEEIPRCVHKLEKCEKEVWVSYGMVPQ